MSCSSCSSSHVTRFQQVKHPTSKKESYLCNARSCCCNPSTDTCTSRRCPIDETCGGSFPCPLPTGNTLVVGSSESFVTIQSAIDAASSGDLILVQPGVYTETINIDKSNITITSATALGATISFPSSTPVPAILIQISGICISLKGFRLQGRSIQGTGRIDRIISVTGVGTSIEIINNVITYDTTYPVSATREGIAINIEEGVSALIRNNIISEYQRTGIRINGNNTCAILISNQVSSSLSPLVAQSGIQISRGASAIIRNNAIQNNQFLVEGLRGTGILLIEESNIQQPVCIERNKISNNDVGIYLVMKSGALVQQNTILSSTGIGILVDPLSPGNVFIQNSISSMISQLDINDRTVGSLTGMTANLYLCNTCGRDNRNGTLCHD